jgi:hypothetical protein
VIPAFLLVDFQVDDGSSVHVVRSLGSNAGTGLKKFCSGTLRGQGRTGGEKDRGTKGQRAGGQADKGTEGERDGGTEDRRVDGQRDRGREGQRDRGLRD